ncbi:PRC-barrel domain-containing protein [Fictibacillus sp. KU28468]|uniref:PRC-barrel domain-containing protein n=1 Tax=Fictibacillus sp. KU28468 TaxID=2991053 RepID=UPI00223CB16A|nr:PRC-barrel domain-containing protein [Fictibacillus sp. KU28468]UZJ80415.1 PRC-barrel domain-containing protein [Fictibacillus sp. KU28468]
MKKSNQFVGLPIISINEGAEIGTVKSLVINAQQGSVDFLTVEHEDWQISVRAVPFKKIVGVGEFAVTIEDRNSIFDLTEIPIANELVQKKISISGARVIDRKGQLLGEVGEFYINEDNGSILGLTIGMNDKEAVLKSEFVVTFGRDLIVVKEESQLHFLNEPEQLIEPEQTLEELTLDRFANEDPLKEKQLELLNGKRASKDIYSKTGNLIIPSGTLLSREDIVKAREEGPSVMVELSMNVAY